MNSHAPFALLTPRLRLRRLVADDADDAEFLLALYNDPDFLRNIGDRGIHTVADARAFISRGPRAPYADVGHGLLCIEERDTGRRLGVCGLVRRDFLPAADLGFALLPAARGHGFAREAAQAVVQFARTELRLPRLFGVVQPDNAPSIRVLESVGMHLERHMPGSSDGAALCIYAVWDG